MSIITQNAALQGLLAAHLPALAEYEGLTPEAITSAIEARDHGPARQPQSRQRQAHSRRAAEPGEGQRQHRDLAFPESPRLRNAQA